MEEVVKQVPAVEEEALEEEEPVEEEPVEDEEAEKDSEDKKNEWPERVKTEGKLHHKFNWVESVCYSISTFH